MLLSEIHSINAPQLDEGLKDALKKILIPGAIALAIAAGSYVAYDAHQMEPARIEKMASNYSSVIADVSSKIEHMSPEEFSTYMANVDKWTEKYLQDKGFSGKFKKRDAVQIQVQSMLGVLSIAYEDLGDLIRKKIYKPKHGDLPLADKTIEIDKLSAGAMPEPDDELNPPNVIMAYEISTNPALKNKMKSLGFK